MNSDRVTRGTHRPLYNVPVGPGDGSLLEYASCLLASGDDHPDHRAITSVGIFWVKSPTSSNILRNRARCSSVNGSIGGRE